MRVACRKVGTDHSRSFDEVATRGEGSLRVSANDKAARGARLLPCSPSTSASVSEDYFAQGVVNAAWMVAFTKLSIATCISGVIVNIGCGL